MTAATFQISLSIAKHGKSLSDGDIVKEAMLSGVIAIQKHAKIKFKLEVAVWKLCLLFFL